MPSICSSSSEPLRSSRADRGVDGTLVSAGGKNARECLEPPAADGPVHAEAARLPLLLQPRAEAEPAPSQPNRRAAPCGVLAALGGDAPQLLGEKPPVSPGSSSCSSCTPTAVSAASHRCSSEGECARSSRCVPSCTMSRMLCSPPPESSSGPGPLPLLSRLSTGRPSPARPFALLARGGDAGARSTAAPRRPSAHAGTSSPGS
mmetsp:Transcript_22088/g.56740  ORF Transcript_22088/g.56740 Transcript_22088/m.56740 type:complete len:204 (-) Transcript_22088:600-1211(-)